MVSRQRERQRRHPEQAAAHVAVRHAIERGLLPPARGQTCSECGALARSYHHPNGYARQHQLDVDPLCAACHAKAHHRPRIAMVRQDVDTGGVSEDEVTLKQAAEARGIPLRTLQRAAKSKALEAREFGDMYATTLDAVDQWLADAHTRPGPKPGSGRARLSQERRAHGGSDGD